jgi:hypothetical protein
LGLREAEIKSQLGSYRFGHLNHAIERGALNQQICFLILKSARPEVAAKDRLEAEDRRFGNRATMIA